MALAGMAGGALWGAVPGFLKARLKVSEIIVTLMMNYIAIALVNYFVFAVWSEGGFQMSKIFPKNAWLTKLGDFAAERATLSWPHHPLWFGDGAHGRHRDVVYLVSQPLGLRDSPDRR